MRDSKCFRHSRHPWSQLNFNEIAFSWVTEMVIKDGVDQKMVVSLELDKIREKSHFGPKETCVASKEDVISQHSA